MMSKKEKTKSRGFYRWKSPDGKLEVIEIASKQGTTQHSK